MTIQYNHEETEYWREQLDASLRTETGWLALAGLFWLNEGPNSVGSDPDCDVALPTGKAAAHVATLMRQGSTVTLLPEGVSGLRVNAVAAVEQVLKDDVPGPADQLELGDLTFIVIKRGERYGIRLWDRNHPQRTSFAGRRWYPMREEMCVSGRFSPHEPPRPIEITNILGDVEEMQAAGSVEFVLAGQQQRLEALSTKSEQLFFILRDQSSGQSTYGMGRFLISDAPQDGLVTLDFNRAYNPPCAFTVYATCPMPPRENHLPIAIEAGELAPK